MREDATLSAHSFYTGIAVGGHLTDGSPRADATVGGHSWVGSHDSGLRVNWNRGVSYVGSNEGYPFADWSAFENLARSLVAGRFARGYRIHVVDQGGGADGSHFDLRDFVTHNAAQGENNGKDLVVFTGSAPVHLRGSADGRQFGPSVLAPFAEVVLHGDAGFIDGIVIARSLSDNGRAQGLQMHGDGYDGPLTCVSSHAVAVPLAASSQLVCRGGQPTYMLRDSGLSLECDAGTSQLGRALQALHGKLEKLL